MFRLIVFSKRVAIPVKSLEKNREILSSVIANKLLKQLSNCRACEYGYFLSVTKLISIGHGDNNFRSEHISFPVEFRCKTFLPMAGEVMTGVVHKILDTGAFLKSGPMNLIYLPTLFMPNYNYTPGENPIFVREDLSKIEIGTVIRFKVFAVRWVEDRRREFRVIATINDEGLGPVSLSGMDGIDL